MKNRALTYLLKFAIGLFGTLVFIFISSIALLGLLKMPFLILVSLVLTILLVLFHRFSDRNVFYSYEPPFSRFLRHPLFLLFFLLLAVWTFPAIFLYWFFEPENLKKGIQVTSLLLGILFSVSYYFFNSDDFKSTADKVSFFSGVILGPPTAFEFLL